MEQKYNPSSYSKGVITGTADRHTGQGIFLVWLEDTLQLSDAEEVKVDGNYVFHNKFVASNYSITSPRVIS